MNKSQYIKFSILFGLLVFLPMSFFLMDSKKENVLSFYDVKSGVIERLVSSSGHIGHRNLISLRPEVLSKVSDVHVQLGDTVSIGQLLISLNKKSHEAELALRNSEVEKQKLNVTKLRVALKKAQSEYKRNKHLYQAKLLEATIMEDVENDLRVLEIDLAKSVHSQKIAEARLIFAEDALSKTSVFSPINGKVVSIDAKVGETVVPSNSAVAGSNMMIVADDAMPIARLKVDETEINSIRVGDKVRVFVVSSPNKLIQGHVESIDQLPFPASDLGVKYLVYVSLEGAKSEFDFREGISCRAEIVTYSNKTDIVVPISSIDFKQVARGNISQFVYILKKGNIEKLFWSTQTGHNNSTV